MNTVSILARPEGRALHRRSRTGNGRDQFQSSPVPKDGRYLGEIFPSQYPDVSILARPEGRALHEQPCTITETITVSILARPEGRALRPIWAAFLLGL